MDFKPFKNSSFQVLVTLNYRLGPLGFLSLGTEEVPGNAGMLDQVTLPMSRQFEDTDICPGRRPPVGAGQHPQVRWGPRHGHTHGTGRSSYQPG